MSRAARTIRLGQPTRRPPEPVPLDALEDVVAFVLAGMEELDRAARAQPQRGRGNDQPPRVERGPSHPRRSIRTERSTHP